ncbi:MAG: DUF4145 domain-containing protein [Paraclostridium sp.]
MLETVSDFIDVFYGIDVKHIERVSVVPKTVDYTKEDSNLYSKTDNIGIIYCPSCGSNRKYKFNLECKKSSREDFISNKSHTPHMVFNKCKSNLDSPDDFEDFKVYVYVYDEIAKANAPLLITGTCLQCDNTVAILIINEKYESRVIRLYGKGGGVTTKHTPKSVKYYLDEAYKCKSIGAYTAAIAMYRTALENLLYDNGYTKGMLSDKIKEFEKAKQDGNAPLWADYIKGSILDKVRDLGNYAVHTNKGDIEKQEYLQDEGLLICIDDVFKYILQKIYEESKEQEELFEKLKRTTQKLRK